MPLSTANASRPSSGFRSTAITDLHELESGSYWPKLRPYFEKPEYQRIRYTILGRASLAAAPGAVALRGASRSGEIEVAFVSDLLAARMSIAGNGLQDYCLTSVSHGQLEFSGDCSEKHLIDSTKGLIYRGLPNTMLSSVGPQDRVSLWIPAESLKQRICALLDGPAFEDISFYPVFDWNTQSAAMLKTLIGVLVFETQAPMPTVLGNELANRSFADLLIYTLLRTASHSYSGQIEPQKAQATPKTLRRAEAFISANVEQPIALHDVAAAAGCSVRSLQLTFRKFRGTTPLLAIRKFRLAAARDALRSGNSNDTLSEVAHRFGFSNLGRFTRVYTAAFGEAPLKTKSLRHA